MHCDIEQCREHNKQGTYCSPLYYTLTKCNALKLYYTLTKCYALKHSQLHFSPCTATFCTALHHSGLHSALQFADCEQLHWNAVRSSPLRHSALYRLQVTALERTHSAKLTMIHTALHCTALAAGYFDLCAPVTSYNAINCAALLRCIGALYETANNAVYM